MITYGQREELSAYAELLESYRGLLEVQQGLINSLMKALSEKEQPHYSLSPRPPQMPFTMSEKEADAEALRGIAPHLNPEDRAALEDYLAEEGFMNATVEVPDF